MSRGRTTTKRPARLQEALVLHKYILSLLVHYKLGRPGSRWNDECTARTGQEGE